MLFCFSSTSHMWLWGCSPTSDVHYGPRLPPRDLRAELFLPQILSRFRSAWREECSSYQQRSLYDESWKRTHIRLEIFSDVSSTRKPSTRPALIQFSKRTRSRHTPLTWCECFCLACATVRKGIFFKFHEFQNISNCFLIF